MRNRQQEPLPVAETGRGSSRMIRPKFVLPRRPQKAQLVPTPWFSWANTAIQKRNNTNPLLPAVGWGWGPGAGGCSGVSCMLARKTQADGSWCLIGAAVTRVWHGRARGEQPCQKIVVMRTYDPMALTSLADCRPLILPDRWLHGESREILATHLRDLTVCGSFRQILYMKAPMSQISDLRIINN